MTIEALGGDATEAMMDWLTKEPFTPEFWRRLEISINETQVEADDEAGAVSMWDMPVRVDNHGARPVPLRPATPPKPVSRKAIAKRHRRQRRK